MDTEKITASLLTYFERETGIVLEDGDPFRVFLLSFVPVLAGLLQEINLAGNRNLTEYAENQYLDAIGDMFGVDRLPPERAETTLKFTLSAAQTTALLIPKGTRVTPGGDIYFSTVADLEILAGDSVGTVTGTAEATGERYNGYLAGTINKMVDQIAFVASVTNTDTSHGGSEAEPDESYRERIRMAPESYSVAGPVGAYAYFAKSVSQEIVDVAVASNTEGTVQIYPLTKAGELSDALKAEILAAVSADNRRPLTDNVTVAAPQAVEYTVSIKYTAQDERNPTEVADAVNAAVDEYINWQGARLGRGINPDELRRRVLNAGAERLTVIAPADTTVGLHAYAKNTGKTVVMIS